MADNVSEPANDGDPARAQSHAQYADVTQRFPQLTDIDSKDDAQRIEIFQSVLDQLSHELDTIK